MRVVDIINPTLHKYFGSESGDTVMVFAVQGFGYPWSDSSVMYINKVYLDEVSNSNEGRSGVYEASDS